MMKRGHWWIGDLCYVMSDSEWDEVCKLTFTDDGVLDGEFNLGDSRRFAIYSTQYGDGMYETSLGKSLGVDSGTIGCIAVGDVRYIDAMMGHGVIVEFDSEFATDSGNGIITIGNVEIDTDVEYSYESHEFDDEDDGEDQ